MQEQTNWSSTVVVLLTSKAQTPTSVGPVQQFRGRGCNKLVPVLRGNGTKIAPTGDICVQPPGEMSWIRGKLADHVGEHAVLSPEEVVLVTSSGTELSHPRPSQSLNNSLRFYSCSRIVGG